MNFEDIVDMDWLNTHTTTGDFATAATPIKEDPYGVFPTDYSSDYYHYSQFDQPLLNEYLVSPLSQTAPLPISPLAHPTLPEIKVESHLAAQDEAMKPKMEPQEMAMPTTDQIRQLIEIAKRQLALREQQQQQQQQQEPQEEQSTSSEQLSQKQQLESHKANENNNNNNSWTLSAETIAAAPLLFTPAAATMDPLPETVAPESLMKSENFKKLPRRESSVSMDEPMSLEAYAETDGIDIKRLTPKERRQLRNKISARNFRVRRKEYITTLEAQVDEHKKHADGLQERLGKVEEENKQLRTEVDSLRRQNQLLQQQKAVAVAASSSTDLVRTPSSPRSPLPKPNLNKDISMRGSKATETYRQDHCILVSNAVMPAWDIDRILQASTSSSSSSSSSPSSPFFPDEQTTLHIAGHILSCFVQLATGPIRSNSVMIAENKPCGEVLLPDERDFGSSDMKQSPGYLEDLYDTLIMTALITNVKSGSVTDKSFWWWGTTSSYSA
ncbi:hypothetical protein DFQ28_011192 [Apophysomyces sp. BC1034]|nr:hypothetical protein DFQ30_011023 [Apophysomyces sp. BC1015]KAG0169519.1 hypothetical protein DFQ29_009650 [Apophysomyces sp. BC1021]KAG0184411.1 hypothetical protein DFQ28_011192 [Apophysomyces sp. BC1034]